MRPIDGDALLEKVADLFPYCGHCDGYGFVQKECVEDIVKEAPTIEQPTWISCAERLPTERGPYLVCYRYKKVFTNKSFYAVLPFDTFNGTLNWIIPKDVEVTHWQPIVPITYEEAEKPNEAN